MFSSAAASPRLSARSPNRMNALALVMIVRDEARSLERCIESARAWVDEIVVVDTGSTDATPEIARRLGARVGRFAWCDDFSAARNAALALAEAPWRLVLDADEWITAGADSLAALRGVAPEFLGQISVASAFDDGQGGVGHAPSWLPRLLPRGVRYAGRIHEQPQHKLPARRLQVVLDHDGYRTQALQAKAGRNARLLAEAIERAPDDAYLLYQAGKDHDVYERWAEAAAAFARSRDCDGTATLHTEGMVNSTPAWHHDRLVREIHALKKCRRHAEAVHIAEAAMALWPESPDFFFALGDLLLDWAAEEPSRARDLLPMIETAWLRCLEIGERPDLEGAVAGRGSTLAAHNLAVLYEGTGRPEKAARLRAAH